MSGTSAAIQAASSLHRCSAGGLNNVLTVISRRTGVPEKSTPAPYDSRGTVGVAHGAGSLWCRRSPAELAM